MSINADFVFKGKIYVYMKNNYVCFNNVKYNYKVNNFL